MEKNNWSVVPLLIVGSKGIWTIRERKALRKSLQGLAKEVRVMSDVELAMHAAFARTQNVSDRIFIVSGTGSIALGMAKSGALFRAGGGGPQKGDEGSGWWIGKEYLRRMKHRKRGGTPSQVAALAKQVLANAPRSPLCAAIIREAQTHLANLIVDVQRQMKSRGPLSISWGGSWMLDDRFRRPIRATVKQKIHRPLRWIHPKFSPDQAAAQQPDRMPQGFPSDLPPRFLTKK
ncbi:MAG: hypothetical protein IPN90_05085 [Elusimicrobia bacterium]|nr:hypothetical protein [Elusimicrobiota bacterium]